MNMMVKKLLFPPLILTLSGCMNLSLDPTLIGTSKDGAIKTGVSLALYDRRNELCPKTNMEKTQYAVEVYRKNYEAAFFHTHKYHSYYKNAYNNTMSLSIVDLEDVAFPKHWQFDREKWCINTEKSLIKWSEEYKSRFGG